MEKAKELVPVLPKDDITKLIIKQAVTSLTVPLQQLNHYAHL